MFRLTILFFALFVFATQAFDNDKATGSKSQSLGKSQQVSLTANPQP